MKKIDWENQDWRVNTERFDVGATLRTIVYCKFDIQPEEPGDDGIRILSTLKFRLSQGELMEELIERLNKAIGTGAVTLDAKMLLAKLESGKFE